jgi:uncharacterized protein (DUF1786 family)
MARTFKIISRTYVTDTTLSATEQILLDNQLATTELALTDTTNVSELVVNLANGGAAQNVFPAITGTYEFHVNIKGYASTTNATVEVVLDGTSTFDISYNSSFIGTTSLTLQSNHGSAVQAHVTARKL